MIRFLTCTSDLTPCPVDSQVWSTTAEILDPAQFGVTAVEIGKVFGWGFGAVILMFFVGLQIGSAMGVVRRL